MKAQQLRDRSKSFAIRVLKFVDTIPKSNSSNVVINQLARSVTSVAANYRAACRARSKAEFIAKLSIVVEEADESLFWIELLEEAEIARSDATTELKIGHLN